MKTELTLQRLASKISKIEGRKHQASIGDIREILKIICGLIAAEVVDKEADYISSIESCIWDEARVRSAKISKGLK